MSGWTIIELTLDGPHSWPHWLRRAFLVTLPISWTLWVIAAFFAFVFCLFWCLVIDDLLKAPLSWIKETWGRP